MKKILTATLIALAGIGTAAADGFAFPDDRAGVDIYQGVSMSLDQLPATAAGPGGERQTYMFPDDRNGVDIYRGAPASLTDLPATAAGRENESKGYTLPNPERG